MFALDIRGHLNSLRLAESKALWPLFEAVVNSIQSIEDSPNRDNGKITIFAQREDQDPNLTIQKDVLERFESFVIEDNGNGMNTANYRSFNTAYSTLKIQKGCKGIGRFLWLKAFETVNFKNCPAVHASFLHYILGLKLRYRLKRPKNLLVLYQSILREMQFF